jgi:hypothetical protein
MTNIFKINRLDFDKISMDEYAIVRDFILNFVPKNIKEMNAILNVFVNMSKKVKNDEELIIKFKKIVDYASELSPGNITSIIKFWINNKEYDIAYKLLESSSELSLSANYYFLEAIINDNLEMAESFLEKLLLKYVFSEDKLVHLLDLKISIKMKELIFDYIINNIVVTSDKLWDKIEGGVKTTLIDNTCNNCHSKLNYFKLNDIARKEIMTKIERHKFDRQNNIKNKEKVLEKTWKEYKKFIDKNKFDLIIDGANVGMFESRGNFNFENIKKVSQSLPNYNILLIIHIRHKEMFTSLPDNITIYYTPKNMYDDLFWIYALVYYNILAISNDQLSDVKSLLHEEKYLLLLSDNMLCRLNKDISVNFPTLPIQKNDRHIHIPNKDKKRIICY